MTLQEWLESLGPNQIQKLKKALGWDDASAVVGAKFLQAITDKWAQLGSVDGFNVWVSSVTPKATPFVLKGLPPPPIEMPPGPWPADPVAPPPPKPDTDPGDGKEWVWDEATKKWIAQDTADTTKNNANAYEHWVAQMKDWGLWSPEVDALTKQFITEGWTEDKFLRELRGTQAHNAAFAEWDMRDSAGLMPISEGQILQLRSQYAALTKSYYGYEPSKQELANLIGASDKSLDEFEHSLQVYKRVQEYGGQVQSLFETIYGVNLSDESLQEFFDPNKRTPEMDKAFDDAKYRGLPTLAGFHARSQDEADLLRNAGMTPEQAFQKFQQAGTLAPIMQKLGAIDANVTGKDFLNDVPLETLAKSVFDFTDEGKAAWASIRQTLAREISRFGKGGGAATDQSGNATGLLTRDQR